MDTLGPANFDVFYCLLRGGHPLLEVIAQFRCDHRVCPLQRGQVYCVLNLKYPLREVPL